MDIQAKGLDYRALNEAIRAAGPSCRITGCLGQRFIGAGMSGRRVEIDGIPGNALGAYLGGGSLTVNAKAQLFKGHSSAAVKPLAFRGQGDAMVGADKQLAAPSWSAAAWATRRATPCGAARSMSRATRAIGQAST